MHQLLVFGSAFGALSVPSLAGGLRGAVLLSRTLPEDALVMAPALLVEAL